MNIKGRMKPKGRGIDIAYRERVRSLGCIACFLDGISDVPAQIHHARDGMGLSQRADDSQSIPLCSFHHLGATIQGRGKIVSIHGTPKKFIEQYGTEKELIKIVHKLLGMNCDED